MFVTAVCEHMEQVGKYSKAIEKCWGNSNNHPVSYQSLLVRNGYGRKIYYDCINSFPRHDIAVFIRCKPMF